MLKVKHAPHRRLSLSRVFAAPASTPERPLLGSMLLGLYADDGHAAARRRRRLVLRGPPRGADRRARAVIVDDLSSTRGASPSGRTPYDPGRSWRPDRAARRRWSGTQRPHCVPCARLAWRRSATSTWRASARCAVPPHGAVQALAPRPRAASCTYEQLEEVAKYDLSKILT